MAERIGQSYAVTKEHIRAFVDIFYFVYGGLNQDGKCSNCPNSKWGLNVWKLQRTGALGDY
jgi:hypothetical protein